MLQAVRVIFKDAANNYSTSVAAHINQSDMESYFKNTSFHVGPNEDDHAVSVNAFFLIQNAVCTAEHNQRFKLGYIYYPDTNKREAAIVDPDTCSAVGFGEGIYHPVGGASAITDILDNGGVVVGDTIQLHKLIHCHDDVYRIYFE